MVRPVVAAAAVVTDQVIGAAAMVADQIIAAAAMVGFEALMLTPVVAGRIVAAVAGERNSRSCDCGQSYN